MRRCLLFLLMSCCLLLEAQPPRHFRHFTEKDGLSDNRVQAIVQDLQGFVWIGTANGLNRYDGYTLRHFRPDPVNPDRSVGHESIHDLKLDAKGNLWIATGNGLNRYDPNTERFRRWVNRGHNDGSLPNPLVWNMILDDQDRLWLSLDNRGLCRYDAEKDRFILLPWREFVLRSLPSTNADAYLVIYFLKHKSAHEFWLQTNVGLFSFDWKKEIFTYHPQFSPPQKTPLLDCPESAYFGSWNQDLLRYDPCHQQWQQIPLPATEISPGTGQHVTDVLPYRNGHCVMTRFGIYWIQNGSNEIQEITTLEQENLSLPAGMITDGFIGKDNTLWVGGEGGLWMAEPQQHYFQYTSLQAQTPYIGDNSYARFLELANGRLLAMDFYHQKLLVSHQGQVEKSIKLPPRAALLHRSQDGRIWVGGGNRLFLLDSVDLSLRPFPVDVEEWNPHESGYFQDMARDSRGRYWFTHSHNGILVWNPVDNSWFIPDSSDGFIGKHMTSVVSDPQRKIMWMGSEDFGLFKYDEATAQFKLFQHDPQHPQQSLAAYTIFDLHLDKAGYLWIATDPGGISRMNPDAPAGQQFFNINTAHGLPSSRVTSISPDNRGRLWISTLGGLACIEPSNGRIHQFTEEDGLPIEFLDQPLFLSRDGSLSSGMKYGFFRFQPDSLLRTIHEPGINLTSFRIFDKELGDSLALTGLSELELQWDANFFQVEWASADVLLSRKTHYAYRLQGFDPAWIYSGNRHGASYTNVPPGNYVLEVKSGIEGVWNPAGLRLSIYIAPPVWQTWWFRILVGLGLSALIFSIYRLRIRQVKHEEALKSEFAQRIARTEMAALRAQMNPHFVFNCLSSINRFILVNQPDEASAYLTKFSRLIRLILDNSRTETVLLSKELDALKLYIEMEQMRFSDRFEYMIDVDSNLQPEHIELPPLLIQPFVENAIWHGLMHKKGACLLTIRIVPDGKRLCIEVEDNGVGRALAMQLKSRSATAQKSHGIQVTSERLEAINSLYGTQATVETIDLFDAKGLPAGTLVKLLL